MMMIPESMSSIGSVTCATKLGSVLTGGGCGGAGAGAVAITAVTACFTSDTGSRISGSMVKAGSFVASGLGPLEQRPGFEPNI